MLSRGSRSRYGALLSLPPLSLCITVYIWLTHTSTLSTLTPHGSVASSSVDCIMEAMDSRSDRISPRFFVPNTFLERGMRRKVRLEIEYGRTRLCET